MPDEVEEQDAVGQRFEEAIATFEAQLSSDEVAGIAFSGDAEALDIDAGILQQLTACLADANDSIQSGDLALADIQLTTPGEVYA